MATKIKGTKVTTTKKQVKGVIYLTDKTKTNFLIDKNGQWEQWGNCIDNLCLSVGFVERLANEFTNR